MMSLDIIDELVDQCAASRHCSVGSEHHVIPITTFPSKWKKLLRSFAATESSLKHSVEIRNTTRIQIRNTKYENTVSDLN